MKIYMYIYMMKMKSHFIKILIYSALVSLLIVFHTTYKYVINVKTMKSINIFFNLKNTLARTQNTGLIKYILLWTDENTTPFVYMGNGQSGFIDRRCSKVNCFVTSNRSYLRHYTEFDVIVFAGPQLFRNDIELPEWRSSHQRYVFASIESADNYGACTDMYNNFFNWTWTYKLESEVRWGYIVIRDKENKIIGPKKNMNWIRLEDMAPVPVKFKKRLQYKTKAAVWFVSNCITKSDREGFALELQMELKKYNHVLDIYGMCGKYECPMDKEAECDKMIANKYYFYLSFENSFSEDYVTEKLLRALNNDVVPIVYGGANYTRFMPDGIYLNARKLGIKKLAQKMIELMNQPEKYAEYFKWKNHYSYHKTIESVETNEYCRICDLLNDDEAMKKITVYRDFRSWWDVSNCTDSDLVLIS